MHRPRLIYYNDAHHYHAKRLEPPASLHMLQWPVDELAGTGADTLALGLGYGDVFFHDTKVGRSVGQRKETWESYIDWRIMRMVEEGRRLGTDQLRACVDRGKELGVRVVPSLKLQDSHAPGAQRCGTLKWERGAAVSIGEEGRHLFGYDYALAEVRDYKLALLREVLEDYGPDGLELDFLFGTQYFKSGEERAAEIMSGFVADLRRLMDEVTPDGQERLPLMVRVDLDEERNQAAGLDVAGWIKAGSVNHVVGQDGWVLNDTEPKPTWLPRAANAAGGAAYYRPPRRVLHEAVPFPHIEMWRALQQTLARDGWAGLYHGYMPWPFDDEEYAFLREMAYPETTGRRDKRYFLAPREGPADAETTTPHRILPLALEEGEVLRVPIHVADDVDGARADGEMRKPILTLLFQFYCPEDDVEMRFNGRTLDLDEAEITDERALFFPVRLYGTQELQAPLAGSYHWFRFRLDVDSVRRGENILEVDVKRCEPRAAFTRSLSGVELNMRYRDMERPLGLKQDRISPRST